MCGKDQSRPSNQGSVPQGRPVYSAVFGVPQHRRCEDRTAYKGAQWSGKMYLKAFEIVIPFRDSSDLSHNLYKPEPRDASRYSGGRSRDRPQK